MRMSHTMYAIAQAGILYERDFLLVEQIFIEDAIVICQAFTFSHQRAYFVPLLTIVWYIIEYNVYLFVY